MKKARGFPLAFILYCIVYSPVAKSNAKGEYKCKKVKKDHSRSGLGSPEVEGQGTTTHETGSHKVPSSNKKQKQS